MLPTVLVTGFLGSGKTTFLNALVPRLHQAGLRVAVIVNELGEVALDALLVQGGDQVAEVTRGSLFCACVRGDLAATMRRLADSVHPDILVIEATGVADPAEIGGFSDHPDITGLYCLMYTVCLASAGRLYKVAQTLAAVQRQLTVADTVVLTGTDTATAEETQRSLAAIAVNAPQAEVVIAPYAHLPEAWWESLLATILAGKGQVGIQVPHATATSPLERANTRFSTRLVRVAAYSEPGALGQLVAILPAGTERAKGLVVVGNNVQVFQYTSGKATLDPAPVGSQAPGWILAIGRFPQPVTFSARLP